MSDEIIAPASESLEAVIVRRRVAAEETNPDIKMHDHIILKDGPRAYKVATHWVITNRRTGEIHHHAVKLATFKKNKAGWTQEEEHSITLDDKDADEISALATFLGSSRKAAVPEGPGDYIVIPVNHEMIADASVRQLMAAISAGGKAKVLADVLSAAQGDADVLRALVQTAIHDPAASKQAAAALTIAGYSRTLETLEELTQSGAAEDAFQAHLAQNPWMFGSEYSELLDRRTWTRNEQQDFVLRRTDDGYWRSSRLRHHLEASLSLLRTSHTIHTTHVANYLKLLVR